MHALDLGTTKSISIIAILSHLDKKRSSYKAGEDRVALSGSEELETGPGMLSSLPLQGKQVYSGEGNGRSSAVVHCSVHFAWDLYSSL